MATKRLIICGARFRFYFKVYASVFDNLGCEVGEALKLMMDFASARYYSYSGYLSKIICVSDGDNDIGGNITLVLKKYFGHYYSSV